MRFFVKLLEICFVKWILDVFPEIAMKLLVTPLSEISSEIAYENAVKFYAILFGRETKGRRWLHWTWL